ncbi:helix-turn-helix domain-containing protein [Rossellomorea vietnamensis]|uniref:helix-turn-helix domain-containing protein n=1 Tax=Rossellomorea vietnamensis TaxID=218284 RepID=UPI001CCF668A|nr:helix-turn-helix transcriptional regulator [Rossellomorea vietnamensis]MCA0151135.1 helix-turn-helix domain-containing protein [Rossellomorea vietnamensis]
MESEFGNLLKSLRKEHKITQRRLAELIGIDFTYISEIENGFMEPPAEDKIIKMAELFKEDPDTMLLAAKKVRSIYRKTITENKNVPMFLRSADKLTQKQWERIKEVMKEGE